MIRDPATLESFRRFVSDRLGLRVDPEQLGTLASALEARMDAGGCATVEEYEARLVSPQFASDESRALAMCLTIGETYFFRHAESFDAFILDALPSLLAARPSLRILSAGCSTGEEPYTIAMLLQERLLESDRARIEIVGIDVNPGAIGKARRATYTSWSLRDTDPGRQARFFERSGDTYKLIDAVRSRVSFEERNLLNEDPQFWRPGAFDVIFCRNVTIYFAGELTRALMARFASVLTPGGSLFLGFSETLRGVSDAFELRHVHGAFYYRRAGDSAIPSTPSARSVEPRPAERRASSSAEALTTIGAQEPWIYRIQRASRRIRLLNDATGSVAGGGRTEIDTSAARALLEQEKYAEALAALDALPLDAAEDPEVLSLRAAVLIAQGDFDRAEACCRRILAADEQHAGSHILTAVCREHLGDPHGARQSARRAADIEPLFAIPHMYLGVFARRAGERDVARRELQEALFLFERESAERILLYGGGLHRDTLMDLCRRELKACGGQS